MSGIALFFSVEHGDNRVPEPYRPLFAGAEPVLASHRGYDPGAGELAVRFATTFHAPCERADITRLLIDQNRSLHNRRTLFSEYSRDLPASAKDEIIERYYRPYRESVQSGIADLLQQEGVVLHLAIHSFTPVLRGAVRNCDIGLMYDPERSPEQRFCRDWQQALLSLAPGWRTRRNYPYRGVSDGIVQALRRQFAGRCYLGLQIEVNQKYPVGDRATWKRLQKDIIESFAQTLERAGRRKD